MSKAWPGQARSAALSQSNEKRKAMIDHIYLPVSDLNRSSEFYKKVLGPLGIDMPYEAVSYTHLTLPTKRIV